jgi:hypothetical protein
LYQVNTIPQQLQQERETLLELGNRLVKLYCTDVVPDITCLTKWTFRDALIRNIALRWNIPYDQLPGEQTLYRAFREHKYSSATKEKLALFYYAITDPAVGLQIQKEYAPLADIQRTQTFPYWNRFVKELQAKQTIAKKPEVDRMRLLALGLNDEQKAILLDILLAERDNKNISASIAPAPQVYPEEKAVA